MTKKWITKLKNISEDQLALIPEEFTIDRGQDKYGLFVKFDGAPFEISTRLQRGIHVVSKTDTKTKSSIIKLLAAAKDADTPNVYTETVKDDK